MLVSTKVIYFGNVYPLVLFENGKKKHNTLTPYIKPNSPYQLLYCVTVPLRYLCYQMNCFGPKKGFRFSWRYVDGKAGYATFKVKMLLLKRNHNQQQSFLTLSRKQMAFNLISFWNMPIIYMSITNNKDLMKFTWKAT
jgi:hypothetical protein